MTPGVTLDISEARRQFNSLDERLASDPIIFVTRHNKRAFAVVDTEFLCAMLETIEIVSDPQSLDLFKQSIEDIRAGRLFDHDDVEKEFG